jgi:hypothetical protein
MSNTKKRLPTTALSPEQIAAFRGYVKAGRHRLGKRSYKSDARIAREVLGSSTPEYADLVRRLMRKYYMYKHLDILKWRQKRRRRLMKASKAVRTFGQYWNPLDHGFFERDPHTHRDVFIPFDGEEISSSWFDWIVNPKVQRFIKYVRSGEHVNGIKIKSYPMIGRELGMSANTVRRWMKWLFHQTTRRKERQER